VTHVICTSALLLLAGCASLPPAKSRKLPPDYTVMSCAQLWAESKAQVRRLKDRSEYLIESDEVASQATEAKARLKAIKAQLVAKACH
jgi:hypothetical protein